MICPTLRIRFALGFVCMIWVAPAYAGTGYELYQTCLKGDQGDTFDETACIRYIQGLWDGLVVAGYPFICPQTEPIQLGQLELIFLKWAQTNLDRLGMEAQFALTTAFGKAFPCPKH